MLGCTLHLNIVDTRLNDIRVLHFVIIIFSCYVNFIQNKNYVSKWISVVVFQSMF